ncbi:MAG TPA: hypothetical protein VF599_22440 [Pyrinomonadaceae bacterium]|jgi:hypothetical protein
MFGGYENNFIFSLLFQAAFGRDAGFAPDFQPAGFKLALEGLAAQARKTAQRAAFLVEKRIGIYEQAG